MKKQGGGGGLSRLTRLGTLRNKLLAKTVGQAFLPVSREEWLQRGFFLTAGEPPLSSNALMALTSAAPLARNSPIRSRATCSSNFSPRGSNATSTRLRSSRLRLRRT